MEVRFWKRFIVKNQELALAEKVIAFIALLLIGCLYSYEWMQIQETYRMNLLGWGMDTVLFSIMVLACIF